MAAALLLAVLVTRFSVGLPAWERSDTVRLTAEVTRLVVGLPVCVVAVLLLADRYAARRGALVLAAGVVWIAPPTVSALLADLSGRSALVAGATILLGVVGTACQPLTVLLLPLFLLPGSSSRRWRRGMVVTATAQPSSHWSDSSRQA
jgi:hypothetical protein